MKEFLHGAAHTLRYEEEKFIWDPLGTTYAIKASYDALLDDFIPSPSWVLWKQVWKSESMPRIKIIIRTVFKGKILITDNLEKRGIQGASRCPLCSDVEESIQDLFVDCSFASQAWSSLHHLLNLKIERNSSIYAIIVKWKKVTPVPKRD